MTNMGTFYRFRVRVINVETAAIQTQVSFDMRNDAQVAFLLGGSSPSVQPAIPTDTSTASATADPPIEGTMVPGASLAAKLSWLQRNAESHNTYILGVNANESIAPATLGYSGGINITIVIRGDSVNRTIRLNANGKMFTVNSNTTFVLDNNITLQGHPGNSGTMVHVNGGTFRMRTGATITGNTNSNASGGGVYVESGTFEMTGGTIRDNTAREYGGGVSMNDSRGIFTMSGGTISGNTAPKGGGVEGGTITMSGGTISGNTASRGGGVNVGRTFIMRGGIITGNTARENGGGIYVGSSSFTKTGGTITGYNSDRTNGNTVRDEEGTIARKGHAVFVNDNRRKETTAGPGDNLSYSNGRATGGWDN